MSIELTPSRLDGLKFVYLGFIVGPVYALASPDLRAVQVRCDVGGLAHASYTVTLATSEAFLTSLAEEAERTGSGGLASDVKIVRQAVKMLRQRLYTLAQERKDCA